MSRAVKEWVGRTDDTPVPPRVKVRIFEKHKGICHISKRKIMPGEPWDAEHVVALCNGGENRESNLAPALKSKHKEKTRQDVAEKSATYKTKKKNLGIRKKSKFLTSRDGPFKAKIGGGFERRKK